MNFSTVIGYLIAVGTVWFAVISHSPNPKLLLDVYAFGLIMGGTLSAALIIFPFRSLIELGKFVLYGVVLKRRIDKKKLVKEIVTAAYLSPAEHNLFMHIRASHPFLTEGFKLLAENQLNEIQLREVLNRRSQYFKQAYLNDAKMLTIIAKFPSSFGMLGSTVGLIDMMSELGKNGQEGIGPAMAMALVATFWGLVLTYMIFMPLGDYAQRLANEDNLARQLIAEGLMLLKTGHNQKDILTVLNGFLALNDRMSLLREPAGQNFWSEIEEKVADIRRSA